jgi:hypothetical protein
VEKSGPYCTKLSALDEIDSLLLKDEEAPLRAAKDLGRSGAKFTIPEIAHSRVTVEQTTLGRPSQCGKPSELDDRLCAEDAGEKALPYLGKLKLPPKTPLQSRGGAFPQSQLNDDLDSCVAVSSVGELEATSTNMESRPSSQKKRCLPGKSASVDLPSNDKTEVFNRLYISRKPWVAGESNSQLLQYLAMRGGTPEIVSPRSLVPKIGGDASISPNASTRSPRTKYRNHRELFDDCLHRDPSPDTRISISAESSRQGRSAKANTTISVSSARGGRTLYSPKQLAAAQASRELSGKIREKIKEIIPIPLDPARAFMEAEASPAVPGSHRPWGSSVVA